VIVSVEYDASGLQWCRICDHRVSGWVVGATGANPQPVTSESLPPPAPDTGVFCPQWASVASMTHAWTGPWHDPLVIVPDQWRGSFSAFLDLLSNGGARRIDARLGCSASAYNTFLLWSHRNPTRVLTDETVTRGFGG
jgi:hypothetical protein